MKPFALCFGLFSEISFLYLEISTSTLFIEIFPGQVSVSRRSTLNEPESSRKMNSYNTMLNYGLVTRLGYSLNGFPFYYSTDTGFLVRPTPRRRLAWALMVGAHMIFKLGMGSFSLWFDLTQSPSAFERVQFYFVASIEMFGFTLHAVTFSCERGMYELTRVFLEFSTRLARWHHVDRRAPDGIEIILNVLLAVIVGGVLIAAPTLTLAIHVFEVHAMGAFKTPYLAVNIGLAVFGAYVFVLDGCLIYVYVSGALSYCSMVTRSLRLLVQPLHRGEIGRAHV